MSRVLLIDDNVVVANVYGAALRNAGHTLEVERDGDAGLAAVSRFKPDVVLLDLALPKSNGLEVLTAIRADPEFARLLVIVFSNIYSDEHLQPLRDAGVSAVLSKSGTSTKQVVEAVRAAVAGAAGPAT